MSNPIRVAIADDHALLRKGIISLLNQSEAVTIIGEFSSGEEAVNFVSENPPDVFLLDIVMAGMTGIEAARWIKEQTPQVKIILISSEVLIKENVILVQRLKPLYFRIFF
jgi:DNA-binding NarL/FixJ family response regulator